MSIVTIASTVNLGDDVWHLLTEYSDLRKKIQAEIGLQNYKKPTTFLPR
jgi:hypothetical protein